MVGAINGKHVQMFAPPSQASNLFNYKKIHSIVLLGVCNTSYKFTLVEIGDSERQSNGNVYANSNLGYAIEHKPLNNINGLTEIRNVGASNTYGGDAKLVRQQFTDYFNNERAVDWQWQIVHRSR